MAVAALKLKPNLRTFHASSGEVITLRFTQDRSATAKRSRSCTHEPGSPARRVSEKATGCSYRVARAPTSAVPERGPDGFGKPGRQQMACSGRDRPNV
jgi:hypothetical protein